ncbi:DUF4097 family beta strand repeat-containing protein [Paenibacillus tarimensis]|uniref:DUF4097 family beta strand repeat-containing protein n=1 Tax=Paenibacillus tarimensis TaxID=416012 RepID=UPI001F2650EF|nr:DUF4097 family beta strand repeat-containing protein [Paenibacillus tarimensis]MCF2942964.1 DUF4097 domain-containing protein [Paenibacillus tarimensis]
MLANNGTMPVLKEECIHEAVTDLSLDWLTGDVQIMQGEGDVIKLVQYGGARFPQEKRFQHELRSGGLTIIDGRKRRQIIGFNIHKTTLAVYLPRKRLNSLTVYSTGGSIALQGIDASKCTCKVTSGGLKVSGMVDELNLHGTGAPIKGEDLTVGRLDLHATSSKVELEGKFSEIGLRSTGRGVTIRSSCLPQKVQSVSTACQVTLAILDHDGFTFIFKKTSGSFKSDFPLSHVGETYSYKNGASIIRAEVRGGQFILRKR